MNCDTGENTYNSYEELKKPSHVTCEICDAVFKNRFDSIIHNTTHIIIPLIKQTDILYCGQCQSIFTCEDDLNAHTLRKHPEECIVKNEFDNETYNFDLDNVKVEEIEEFDTNPKESLKDRLKFEDEDVTCNGILKDFVTECKVNVKICDEWNGLVKRNGNSGLDSCLVGQYGNLGKNSLVDRLVLDEPLTDEYACDNFISNDNVTGHYESIHYRTLIKPGIHNCRHCPKSFANRFTLIQHEVIHMRLIKPKPLLCPYCDKFIAGNHYDLHRHIDKWHSRDGPNIYITPKTCNKCGLWYRKYGRHARNYHNGEHPLSVSDNLKIENVCDLCLPSVKAKCKLKCKVKGTTEPVVGGRFPCQVCGGRFFVLNIVERTDRVCNRPRKMSNEIRLKMIQRRFQRLNLLSKV